ncbi:MAG: copper-containing nitrite reductase [Chloroflexi bacterium OLB14]|nr:MAG: copper-containing nitrite reductase [Chloroflexi bacterium OLB14]
MNILKKFLSVMLILVVLSACAPTDELPVSKEFVLTSDLRDGQFVFVGVNGDINGVVNPSLRVSPGERISVMLVNSGWGNHNIVFPDLKLESTTIKKQGETTSLTFTAPSGDASLEYYDANFKQLGMRGILVVGKGEVASVVEYTLDAKMVNGKMLFIGVGGDINGQENPNLTANPGDLVRIHLTSSEGILHNFYLDEFNVKSADASTAEGITVEFVAGEEGTFTYYCAVPGHKQLGMFGKLIVGSGVSTSTASTSEGTVQTSAQTFAESAGPADENAVDISHDPTDIPAPIGAREAQHVMIELETVELTGVLADGTTYKYWTFNRTVPGPFLRVRVGDTVELRLKNLPDSLMAHSIDLHAVTGPGGGAVATQTTPGGETVITFKALNVGLFVYHCATPMVAHHMANGMYGLILVEPEGGLPPVDREFYVMQGEVYTAQKFGTTGATTEDVDRLLDENPEYFVFNGASLALASEEHMLHAKVGETVRIFFGVGGPNFTSSFHVIGEIFDRVYNLASLTSAPLTDVQTTLVPPGGATMVEFKLEVPGNYTLVDHALSRAEHGLAGILSVEGDANPEIFDGEITPGSGH